MHICNVSLTLENVRMVARQIYGKLSLIKKLNIVYKGLYFPINESNGEFFVL